ncbi:MAG: choice-of-anchor V domain-containing protein [Ignavibacteriota bacterium]
MKKLISKTIFIATILVVLSAALILYSNPNGKTGRTKKMTDMGCGGSGCHTGVGTTITAYFYQKDTVYLGQSVLDTLSVTETNNNNKNMGLDVAVLYGRVDTVGGFNRIKLLGDELTHTQIWQINPAKWRFRYIADIKANLVFPAYSDSNVTLTPNMDWDDVPMTVDSIYGTVASKISAYNWAPTKRIVIPAAVKYGLQISTNANFTTFVLDTSNIMVSNFTVPAGKLNNSTTYYWRVKSFSSIGTFSYSQAYTFKTAALTSVSNQTSGAQSYKLFGNYPNPFNPETKIKFSVGEKANSRVRISIYDLSGKQIAELVNQKLQAGSYEVNWNAGNTASGFYVCKMTAGSYSSSLKMILIK